MIYFYKNEKKIVKYVRLILDNYANSKERTKKENELFHLLCFMDIDKKQHFFEKIIPNEPGDFILKIEQNDNLIEVVECFGNVNTYVEVKNRLNTIFDRKKYKDSKGEYKFSIDESILKFNAIFRSKNEKKYLQSEKYSKKILLIVTGEYENCPITGNWVLKFLEEKDFFINKYDELWLLDYYSSGKDGGPTINKNLLEDLIEYKKYIK